MPKINIDDLTHTALDLIDGAMRQNQGGHRIRVRREQEHT